MQMHLASLISTPNGRTAVILPQTLVAAAVDPDYSEAVKKYFLKRFALNVNLAL